jgi:hypothetical protein
MSLDLLGTSQPGSLEGIVPALRKGLSNYNRYIQGKRRREEGGGRREKQNREGGGAWGGSYRPSGGIK